METYTLINIFGLALDLVGVIIIFFFGIPPRFDIKGQEYRVTGGVDQEEIIIAKKYKKCSMIGLIAIFVGFLMQLISNFIK